jgi:hypothetical protein
MMTQELNEIKINGVEYVKKDAIQSQPQPIGDFVIVRTHLAGVFAGYIKARKYCENNGGLEVTMTLTRRIWYWDGAATLSQLAMEGTSKPENCKFPGGVSEITLPSVIEIIPCTETAKKSILGVPVWSE